MTLTPKERRERVKAWLREHADRQREARQILQQLRGLEDSMTAPPGMKMDGMPHGGTAGDAMANYMIRKERLMERYWACHCALIDTQEALESVLATLEPGPRMLLRYRYIDGLRWEDICEKMTYSWRQIHRLHGQALKDLEPVLWPIIQGETGPAFNHLEVPKNED